MNARKYQVAKTRKFTRLSAIAGASLLSVFGASAANAEDWSTVTGGLDFSGEIAGVIAVVGVLAGFYVVRKGARLLLSMIK